MLGVEGSNVGEGQWVCILGLRLSLLIRKVGRIEPHATNAGP